MKFLSYKKGSTEWTMGKIVSVILLVIFLILIFVGVATGAFKPMIEQIEGKANWVLNWIFGVNTNGNGGNVVDRDIDFEGMKGRLEMKKEACVAIFDNGEQYGLNFDALDSSGNPYFFKYINKKWVNVNLFVATSYMEFLRGLLQKLEYKKDNLVIWYKEGSTYSDYKGRLGDCNTNNGDYIQGIRAEIKKDVFNDLYFSYEFVWDGEDLYRLKDPELFSSGVCEKVDKDALHYKNLSSAFIYFWNTQENKIEYQGKNYELGISSSLQKFVLYIPELFGEFSLSDSQKYYWGVDKQSIQRLSQVSNPSTNSDQWKGIDSTDKDFWFIFAPETGDTDKPSWQTMLKYGRIKQFLMNNCL